MDMIKKQGKYYVLYSKDGKRKLGQSTTFSGIKKREKEVKYYVDLAHKAKDSTKKVLK